MKKKTAQTLLTNGRFLTMEQPGEIAEAVAIANGRILFVGSAAEAAQFVDANTTVIDLQGKVAAPGLIDCHTHPMGSYAVRYSGVNLLEVRSVEAMLERIRERAARTPKGEWIVARGFDESKLGGAEVNAALLEAFVGIPHDRIHRIFLSIVFICTYRRLHHRLLLLLLRRVLHLRGFRLFTGI